MRLAYHNIFVGLDHCTMITDLDTMHQYSQPNEHQVSARKCLGFGVRVGHCQVVVPVLTTHFCPLARSPSNNYVIVMGRQLCHVATSWNSCMQMASLVQRFAGIG